MRGETGVSDTPVFPGCGVQASVLFAYVDLILARSFLWRPHALLRNSITFPERSGVS
jgi:hypothetical protein